jgi:uncharacterized membrane protein YhaH (DUF805 family)
VFDRARRECVPRLAMTGAWSKTDSLLHRDSTRTGGMTMTFSDAISSGFRNYVGFSGRAARSEFWYWILFTILVDIVASIIDVGILSSDVMPLSSIWSLATFLPSLAMGVRRLHDTDRSGWWWLIVFIPLIGIIVLIVFWCFEGTRGPNRFGPDPLGALAAA